MLIFNVSALTPMEYAKSYVQVSTGRKLLYGEIFNRFSDESGIENEAASIKLQVTIFSCSIIFFSTFAISYIHQLIGFAGEFERSDGPRVVCRAASAPVRAAGPRAVGGGAEHACGLSHLLRCVRHRGARAGRPVGTAARRAKRPQAPGRRC
jgi:hypothetical protein